MLPLTLPPLDGPLRVLCLGAHADDLEIGCGGTVLTLLEGFPAAEVTWIVFSGDALRGAEARESAEVWLRAAGRRTVVVKSFRDGFFPHQAEIKEYFEELKGTVDPHLVFTHWEGDRHQDHRTISALTWNTFRDHLILEYEVPKYDGDLGRPNLYMPLRDEVVGVKVEHLIAAFSSQRAKRWFTEDLFRGLMRLRGMEAGGTTRYAEAFYVRKATLASPDR